MSDVPKKALPPSITAHQQAKHWHPRWFKFLLTLPAHELKELDERIQANIVIFKGTEDKADTPWLWQGTFTKRKVTGSEYPVIRIGGRSQTYQIPVVRYLWWKRFGDLPRYISYHGQAGTRDVNPENWLEGHGVNNEQ